MRADLGEDVAEHGGGEPGDAVASIARSIVLVDASFGLGILDFGPRSDVLEEFHDSSQRRQGGRRGRGGRPELR